VSPVTRGESLFTGVYSVVPTRRRRFFWAAWWRAPPDVDPFRKPDASSGGARTVEEARAEAERAAGRTLVEADGRWAGAALRVQRGDPPWPKPRVDRASTDARVTLPSSPPTGSRTWALGLLGVTKDATADDIKRAFRALALRTHPDRGGDDAAFIEAKRALEVALGDRRRRPARRS
jgi:hypothetical protein